MSGGTVSGVSCGSEVAGRVAIGGRMFVLPLKMEEDAEVERLVDEALTMWGTLLSAGAVALMGGGDITARR